MTKGTIEAVGVEKLAAGAPLRRIGDEDDPINLQRLLGPVAALLAGFHDAVVDRRERAIPEALPRVEQSDGRHPEAPAGAR
jgi:hypothetical protein